MSYTPFQYFDLTVARPNTDGLDMAIKIRNTGHVSGDETPQVYLDAPATCPANLQCPIRKLVAFDRVSLNAGEAKTVHFYVPLRQLQHWSAERHQWISMSSNRTLRRNWGDSSS